MQLNKSLLAIDYGQTELWTFVILESLSRLKIMLAWFTYYIDTFDKGGVNYPISYIGHWMHGFYLTYGFYWMYGLLSL